MKDKPPFVRESLERTPSGAERNRRRYRRGSFSRVLPANVAYTSPGFMAAYSEAEAAWRALTPEVPSSRVKDGSIDAHISRYWRSPDWARLAEGTRKSRRSMLVRFADMTIASGTRVDDLPLDQMEERDLRKLLAPLPPFSRGNMLKALRSLIVTAIEAGALERDATAGIKLRLPKTGGFHSWTAEEIRRFRERWPEGSAPRLAMELAMWSGQRRSDLVRLGWSDIEGELLVIHAQAKTQEPAFIRVEGGLKRTLSFAPKGERFLLTSHGRPWGSPQAFGNAFHQWCVAAGMPEHCAIHGLRKAFCAHWAEQGKSTHEIAAMSGHLSINEVDRYTRAADRRRLVLAMEVKGSASSWASMAVV